MTNVDVIYPPYPSPQSLARHSAKSHRPANRGRRDWRFYRAAQTEAEPERVRAITMVAVEGEHTAAVLKSLRGIPEVQALHTTNGRWDIVVELGVESLEAFDQALQRIRLIKGISNSETSLLLSTHKI